MFTDWLKQIPSVSLPFAGHLEESSSGFDTPALTSLVPTTSISWCLLTLPKYGLATKLSLGFRSPSLADETKQILRGSPSRSFFSFTTRPNPNVMKHPAAIGARASVRRCQLSSLALRWRS